MTKAVLKDSLECRQSQDLQVKDAGHAVTSGCHAL